MSFKFSEGALLIFDEGDTFMLDVHNAFKTFIKSNNCVCLTGTPSNSKQAGTENKLLDELAFDQIDAILDADYQPPTIDKKVLPKEFAPLHNFIKEELNERPVLLRCSSNMLKQL
jgi:hypothetical protein